MMRRVKTISDGAVALALGIVSLLGSVVQGAPEVWPPTNGIPMTRWGQAMTEDAPVLPEYPRPQMVRERWLNLNGYWNYAIVGRSNAVPSVYTGKIRVPFPAESVLSEVNKRVGEENRLWYRRTFQIPADWKGQRVLLHFGAVDWETTVSVNGKAVGTHQGGYDGFSFDITDALTASGPQEVVVAVWDPIEGGQPNGKQGLHPEGIFYTPVTGIWQTVWLEPVPQTYIRELKIVPDVDGSQVRVSAVVNGDAGNLRVIGRIHMIYRFSFAGRFSFTRTKFSKGTKLYL